MSRTGDSSRLDDIFRAMCSPVRRHVLYYLQVHGDATLDELSTAMTGWEAIRDGNGHATADDYDRMRSSLYHTHLPKLAKTGVIRYDRDDEHVTLTDLPTVVKSLLDLSQTAEPGIDDVALEHVRDAEE